ncbi:hypothetical protein SCHPADRAFT_1003308 [Schizopora paradoxa]|uniref:F-box domain-containing protein n=1 Tax=Schizopora paradoxa TaxID=27342 RepID=A0A0H2QZL8_9AGAM|nr:hypothetical protein SCHPADRAFT_1003308 [Schizopora paradoxa]
MPPTRNIKATHTGSGGSTLNHAPPKKQATRKKSSKKVAPSLLLTMPNEILAEIAKHLSPEDLLRLARTSRLWRCILMSKTSKFIWEGAFAELKMPKCPADMNEPQIVDLLFGKGCTSCLAPRTCKETFFVFRARLCKRCKEELCFETSELEKMIPLSASISVEDVSSMLPRAWVVTGRKMEEYALRSEYDSIMRVLQEYPHGSEERNVYIAEKKESARAIIESAAEMKRWFEDHEREKMIEHHKAIVMRRITITNKLKELGYTEEDLDSRFDERGWKWNSLLDISSPLTEKSWRLVFPQLSNTIELRRALKAPEFHELRRFKREGEMKAHLSESRPQLEIFAKHKLFLDADLLELPIVKELIEENECRIPVTEERWLAVWNILPQAVEDLATQIEEECDEVVHEAKKLAMQLAKDRYYAIAEKSWEEQQERFAQRSSDDEGDTEYEDIHPDEDGDTFEDIEYNYQFDNRGHQEGSVPLRLLSAQSLLEVEIEGVKTLTSYAAFLRKRASKRFFISHEPDCAERRVAWSDVNVSSSKEIVDTAESLLEDIQLTPQAKMAYMMACGSNFRCKHCFRGPAARGVTWPELVQHFLDELQAYRDLCEKNIEQRASVPLQNDHCLDVGECGRVVGGHEHVTMPHDIQNIAGGPFTDAGQSYTELAATWGFELHPGIADYLHLNGDEPAGVPFGGLADMMPYEGVEANNDIYTEKCRLCAALGVVHGEMSPMLLVAHMERKHGTDLDGNLLGGANATT